MAVDVLASRLFVLIAVVLGGVAQAQQDAKVTTAAGSGPFADAKAIQAAGTGTIASRVLNKVSFEAPTDQIKFEIQILSVDSETRDKIYKALGDSAISTEITTVGEMKAAEPRAASASELSSQHTITTGSIVSTAVLEPEQVQELYGVAKQSESSRVLSRPNIISAGGQAASYQQLVQRPFLSDLQQVEVVEGAVTQTGVQSDIQVLNEGTELTVVGEVEGETLNVHARIQHSKVKDVEHHHVYGVGEAQSTIQVPSHEVRLALASGHLKPKQTMLLDPYLQTKYQVNKAKSSVVLEQIPYVGESFKQADVEEVTMNTIVLLRAKKL